tara:strand:+ start:2093 stop:2323 length:231 start_codon:yes stop_codon:yes gene_type:complete
MFFDNELQISFETWLDRYSTASASGSLTIESIMSSFIESTGYEDVDADEVYSLMSERYHADRGERGELIFRAILNI